MPKPTPILVANLKANKNWQDLDKYFEEIAGQSVNFPGSIIVCPSAPFLEASNQKLKTLDTKITLGSQDVSKFTEGPYTGEYSVSQLQGTCQYSLVGHSERKKYFNETTDDVLVKIDLLLKSQITPILCIASEQELEIYSKNQLLAQSAAEIIFVHEPPGAISAQSTYKPQDTQEANKQALKIKQKFQGAAVLYGGSVNPQNVKSFLETENIDGALIGQASLNPSDFIAIIKG